MKDILHRIRIIIVTCPSKSNKSVKKREKMAKDRLKFWKRIDKIYTKGQLISKCPFGVIVWTKIPTKRFDKFCPRI